MASPNHPSPSAQSSRRRTPENPSHRLAARAVDAMADKKASDVTVIDLRGVSSMADFFVLGTGESDLQVKAIANGVVEHIEDECEEAPWKREGTDHYQWVVLDYVDIVVHVFLPSKRDRYRLEHLWGEADSEMVPTDGDASDLDLLQNLFQQSADTA